jgi:hypothetical protein
MNTSIPIILIGCEHDGATEADYSPIAWPATATGSTFGGSIRTKNLASSAFRLAWLWLPPRTKVNAVGRVVVSSLGKQGIAGTLILPTYTIYRCQQPVINQANGNFTSVTGQQVAISSTVTDTHTSGNWTGAQLTTNVDLSASTDHIGQPLTWFSSLALRIQAPYGSAGGSYGMYLTGIAVENW